METWVSPSVVLKSYFTDYLAKAGLVQTLLAVSHAQVQLKRDLRRAFLINAQSKGHHSVKNVKNANHRQLNE